MFYTLAYFFAYENWWFTSIPASNYRALAMCESLAWSKHHITQLNASVSTLCVCVTETPVGVGRLQY